jgi:hypothetical protein
MVTVSSMRSVNYTGSLRVNYNRRGRGSCTGRIDYKRRERGNRTGRVNLKKRRKGSCTRGSWAGRGRCTRGNFKGPRWMKYRTRRGNYCMGGGDGRERRKHQA